MSLCFVSLDPEEMDAAKKCRSDQLVDGLKNHSLSKDDLLFVSTLVEQAKSGVLGETKFWLPVLAEAASMALDQEISRSYLK